MFGSAAQAVTKTKSSLPALKESQNHQKAAEAQVTATKKSGRLSRFGKFRVETKKTQGSGHMGHHGRAGHSRAYNFELPNSAICLVF